MLQLKLLNRILTAFFIFFLFITKSFPQNKSFHFDHISIEQGLLTNSVNCVYQDGKGFIWIGTAKGLVRFDGYNFKTYQHKNDDNSSLSNDFVTSILEDSTGNFWIGTQNGGVNKFDRYLNTFSCLKNIPYDTNSIIDNNITTLFEDKGILWVGTRFGPSKLNSDGNKFKNYYITDSMYSNKSISFLTNPGNLQFEVSRIIKDRGTYWIGSSGGLMEFNLQNNSFSNYRVGGEGGFHIRSLIKENESNILIASDEGLYRFNKASKQFQPLLQEPITDLIKTKDGKLWCTTNGNGIVLYDIQDGTTFNYNKDSGNSTGIVSTGYKNIFIDKAGSIWFTSIDEGINILHPNFKLFKIIRHDPQNKKSLSFNIVNKGITDKNNITWLPTDGGGLDKYNPTDKSFIHLKESSLKEDKINSVFIDDFGRLWAGTNTGLYNLRFNIPTFEKISFGSYLIKDLPVKTIAEDREGNIWLGILDHLVKYSPIMNENTIINLKHDSTSTSKNFNTTCILNDNDILWISTSNGLYKYDIKKNSTNLFLDTGPYGIENQFWTVLQDWEGLIWLGSNGGGLKCFNPQTSTFTSYKIENGFPSNNILSIQEDAEGSLWLGTDKGLVNFNNKSGSITLFTISDGIPSNKFVPNAAWTSPSGEFFFGTTNGVVSFFPTNIISNKYIPAVVLTSFKIFNKEVALNFETSNTTELEIPYKQNVISFEVAALNYINPERNQFAYKLEGVNAEWIYIRSQREISFNNLSPGSYILRIKASNNDGQWNESGLSIKLRILPPWYKTWWAYIIYMLIIIAVYLGLRKYELKKIKVNDELRVKKLESELLHAADKVKSDFFNNVSHALKTPLTQIIEPVSQLKKSLTSANDKKIIELVDQNAQRLLQQINQLIDLSELEARSMRLQASRNDCVPFLRGLIMNFDQAAKLKNIELSLYSPMDHINIYFDPDKIEKIISNLLSNAIKFTPEGGSIIVAVELKSARLYIKIKDNGIGIPADKLNLIFKLFYKTATKDNDGLGIGLTLTKKLVELHKGEIQVISKPGIGTTFTFWLNTDEKVYNYTEIIETDKVNLTFRPLSKGNEISTAFLDHTEKQIVLLIEENSEMRRLISSQLELNYAVFECQNSKEGYEKAKEFIPDIIVIDIRNSQIDGNKFCSLVKNDETTSHIPIIIFIENTSQEDKIAGAETGADDYLVRPFNKVELLMKIKNLITARRKNREILGKETITGMKVVSGFEIEINRVDRTFINKVVNVVDTNYTHSEFNIEQFCSLLGMSQTQLLRKMSALFNTTPNEFILRYRLYKAAKLIKDNGKTITKAAYESGFDNLSYFTKCYRAEFGQLPAELGN